MDQHLIDGEGPAAAEKTRITRADPRRLGEIIKQYADVTEEDVQSALERSKKTGLPLGEQLVEDGKINEDDRVKCLSVQWGLPFVNLRRSRISEEVASLVDKDYQIRSQVLLLRLKAGTLSVGIVDPLNVDVVDAIRVITGYAVKPMMVSRGALYEKYLDLFGWTPDTEEKVESSEELEEPEDLEPPPPEMIEEVVGDIESGMDDQVTSTSQEDDIHDVGQRVDEMPVIRLVNSVLAEGIRRGASDVHLQAEADRVQVRYRVDGILQDGPNVPRSLMRVVQARVKVMAGLDFSNRMSPQDGRMSLRVGKRSFEARVSVLPAVRGPKIVLRLAEQSDQLIGLDNLSFHDEVLRDLRTTIHRPYGMMLITGPTGSGKSTTLYSAISEVNTNERNILTVEDPVEYQLAGITQAEIKERAGLSFASVLRAALRQDPDVIMVGEIRDEETAEIATHASLTGHLVLSTLHTNDAPSAVTRLIDMGIQPFLVASSLIGVPAQRLSRKICPECGELFEPTEEEVAGLDISLDDGPVTLVRPKGCSECRDLGYKGRLGIFEFLVVEDQIKRLILARASDEEIRDQAAENGMISLVNDVSNKVMERLTTLEEAHRVVFI